MDRSQVAAYLERLGSPPTGGRPSAPALTALQGAHLRAVPFENLSIHLGEPVVLDEARLVDKIVGRRRGGFCYELNGAFAALLVALGYPVTLLAARVFSDDGALGPPFDHLALAVEASGRWLVDVGFGDFSLGPLRLDDRGPQADGAGVFAIEEAPDGDLDVVRDGRPQYRLELRPRALADFIPTCWWHQTSPESHFTRTLTCSRVTPEGRVTLADHRLIRTAGGARTEEQLDDRGALAAYRDCFGIVLDRLPPTPRSAP